MKLSVLKMDAGERQYSRLRAESRVGPESHLTVTLPIGFITVWVKSLGCITVAGSTCWVSPPALGALLVHPARDTGCGYLMPCIQGAVLLMVQLASESTIAGKPLADDNIYLFSQFSLQGFNINCFCMFVKSL